MNKTTVSLQSFYQGDQVWCSNGERIALGPILGQGGEGAVYEVAGKPEFVAKLYHKSVSQDRIAKLSTMVTMSASLPILGKFCAWPASTLHARVGGTIGGTMGFLMRRVSSCKEIHHLTSPTTRKREFPNQNWSFLFHVARNLACAVETIHSTGTIIGDINEGGFLVTSQGTVWVLDCDSFQVNIGSRIHRCEVGIADYTPPELQDIQGGFGSVVRTANHDNFGLAVIIFKLLMMGRHPYAGIYGGPERDADLSSLIRDNRFAYGPQATARQNRPPPYALSLSHLTPRLENLFCSAFGDAGKTSGRPQAKEWISALEEIRNNFATCQIHSAHKYIRGTACPWCVLEPSSGVLFFLCDNNLSGSQTWHLNVAPLRHLIAKLPPFPSNNLPPIPFSLCIGTSMDEVIDIAKRKEKKSRIGCLLWGIAVSGLLLLAAPVFGAAALVILIIFALLGTPLKASTVIQEEINRRQVIKNCRLKECKDLENAWASFVPNNLRDLRAKIDRDIQLYEGLSQKRQDGLLRLEKDKIKEQQRDFLEGIQIRGHKIHFHITAAKIATLESFGISTAAEINKENIMKIHGFGGRGILADALVHWQQHQLKAFKPNNRLPVEKRVIANFDQDMNSQRSRLELQVNQAAHEFTVKIKGCLHQRDNMLPAIAAARNAYLQAESDENTARAAAKTTAF